MGRHRIDCSDVRTGSVDSCEAVPAKYAQCASLPLLQHWLAPGRVPKEQGTARVGRNAEGLWFHVRLEDGDILTTATEDNQCMWQLGDVVEFFVKPGVERPDYWEIHITPNGLIMDIHIPERAGLVSGEISWAQVIAADSRSRKWVKSVPGQGVWAVELCVPWATFGVSGVPEPGTTWQFAVCRYNCTGGLEDPELSSTAHYTQPGFHRYEDYHDLVF